MIKKNKFRWALLASSIIMMAACSKPPGLTGTAEDGLSAQGLGSFGQFSGQEAGESYTTQVPHNQTYLFAYDSSELNPKYLEALNAQAQYLKSHSGSSILLAGHTDERGSREYNVALGENRANTVEQIIRMAGVERQQIRVVSYGKERPVNLGHDESAHGQNRRVELIYEATH